MSKATERKERLLPGGIPTYVRCYDNGGSTADRYTIVFSGNFKGRNRRCYYIGCSSTPFHPQSICQHGDSADVIDKPKYSHLGKKVKFETLCDDVKKVIMSDYNEFWELS